jgi:hypothetical protein
MAQLHKKFTDSQVKELMERYLRGEIKRTYLQEILGIKRRRFWVLVKQYRQNSKRFSIQYQRARHTRRIAPSVEKNILKELKIEQKLIQNKDIPLKSYNYSFIRDRLKTQFNQRVSLPTIIDRAKKVASILRSLNVRLMTERY